MTILLRHIGKLAYYSNTVIILYFVYKTVCSKEVLNEHKFDRSKMKNIVLICPYLLFLMFGYSESYYTLAKPERIAAIRELMERCYQLRPEVKCLSKGLIHRHQ